MQKKYMCYITYAVPSDELRDFLTETDSVHILPPAETGVQENHPEGFVPEWFYAGGFPEDDPVN